MKNIKEKDLFESSDLSLVGCLCVFGYKIEAIDKTNPARAVFFIERDKGLDEIVQGFWSQTLKVDPQHYFGCLKNIKTRIYQ